MLPADRGWQSSAETIWYEEWLDYISNLFLGWDVESV